MSNSQTQTKRPVIAYYRTSSLGNVDGHSMSRQQDAVQDWCSKNDSYVNLALVLSGSNILQTDCIFHRRRSSKPRRSKMRQLPVLDKR